MMIIVGTRYIASLLPELLREAGVCDIQLQVVQPTFMDGGAKRIHQITLENISEAIIAGGLASAAELAAVTAELDAFAQNPHTLIGFPRIVQVWGRVGRCPAQAARPAGRIAGSAWW